MFNIKVCIVVFIFCLLKFTTALAISKDQLFILNIDNFVFQHPVVDTLDNYLKFLVLRPLFTYDLQNRLICEWCTVFPSEENGYLKLITENKVNKILITIRLKDSAKWADGTAITVNDFILSYNLYLEHKSESYKYWWINYIDSIVSDSNDLQKFSIKIIGHDKSLLKILTMFFIIPYHLESKVWSEDSFENISLYFKNTNYFKKLDMQGLYNGPFVIKKHDTINKIIYLEQNPYFISNKPLFKNIVFKYQVSLDDFINLMKDNNKLVIVKDFLYLASSLQDKFINYWRNNNNIHELYDFKCQNINAYEVLIFNLRNPIFKDIRFRTFLRYNINKKKIEKELFKNIYSLLYSANTFHKDNIFDKILRLALENNLSPDLLSLLGWHLNLKDNFLYKDNKKLQLTLDVVKLNLLRKNLFNILKLQLNKVGVDLVLNNDGDYEINSDIVERSNFKDIALLSWVISDFQKIPRVLFHSKEIASYDNNYRGLNIGAWHNYNVDKILDLQDISNKSFSHKSINIEEEFLKEYKKDLPFIPLFAHKHCVVIHKNLKNYSFLNRVFPSSSLYIETWNIKNVN